MCGQLSLLDIYLLSNGFKYEDIVSNLRDLKNDFYFYFNWYSGNILGGYYNDNDTDYPSKFQNDTDYINTTGDTLTDDLNLNGNKLYLNNNKKQSIYQNSDDIVFETDDKFIVKNNRNNT